jgi:hypothetical protein
VTTDTITLFLLDLTEVVIERVATSAVHGLLVNHRADTASSTVDNAVDRVAGIKVVARLALSSMNPLIRGLHPAAVDEVVSLVWVAPETVAPPSGFCGVAITTVTRSNRR